jgi:hypothetical protein
VTDLGTTLLAAKMQDLRLRPVVLLDWRDGPIEGIADIGDMRAYWLFRLFAERASHDDLDDRVYLFSPISEEVMTSIQEFDSLTADRPLVWPFDSDPNPLAIRGAVDKVVSSSNPPLLLIRSADFRRVQGIWRVAATKP